MWERILVIIRKEFLQTFREPRMRAMLFGPPLIQFIIFGYAVNMDVENARIAWFDQDRTPQSRELRAMFDGSPYFTITHEPADDDEMRRLLDKSMVQAVVRVNPGFARDILRGRTAAVQGLVDGTDSNTASLVGNYIADVIRRYANQVMQEEQQKKLMGRTAAAGGAVNMSLPRLNVQPRAWFNPDLKSRNYFVPGTMVNIITLVTLMLTAMAIVREKEIGTMEQLMVTPIRPVELILGKTLPFALVGLFDTVLVILVAVFWFGVPLRGSLLFLFACAIVYLLTTLGAGLFISTVSNTQQQAMMSTFIFFQPAFMLSGFSFPIANMPEPVQWLTYLNPVRYFLEIVRALFLKGSGIAVLWPQMLGLTIIGIAVLGMSVIRFRKRLD